MRFDTVDYEALGAYVGVHKTAASAGVGADGTLRLRVYFTGDTGYIDVAVTADGRASGEFFAMNGTKLEGKPLPAAGRDLFADTWDAMDALGRKLGDASTLPAPRKK